MQYIKNYVYTDALRDKDAELMKRGPYAEGNCVRIPSYVFIPAVAPRLRHEWKKRGFQYDHERQEWFAGTSAERVPILLADVSKVYDELWNFHGHYSHPLCICGQRWVDHDDNGACAASKCENYQPVKRLVVYLSDHISADGWKNLKADLERDLVVKSFELEG